MHEASELARVNVDSGAETGWKADSPSNGSDQMHHRQGKHEGKRYEDDAEAKNSPTRITILKWELKGPRWLQFLLLVLGVFSLGVIHDFVQELVFRYEGFDYGWFMTLWELLIFVVAAWLQLWHEGRYNEIRSIDWKQYLSLTVVLAITQGFGSISLSYVNFPVKVVMKSSKLIPTMALGILILKRTYTPMEYISAFMLCTGVASFTLVDSKVSPKFDPIGILLLSGAVAGDAITVNLQERILRQLQCSKEQMMLASNLMAAVWVLMLICVTGEMFKAINLIQNKFEIGGLLLLQALAQYLSVSFYLGLIQGFGGVVAICVTSCRKVITIVLSFVAFSKPFSFDYIPSGLLVLCGIMLSVIVKQPKYELNHAWFLIACGAVCTLLVVRPALAHV